MNGYFDYNATAPMFPVAREALLKACDVHWHNASGLYRDGAMVRRKLDEARERLGEVLGCEAERVVFTSGATESNNALFTALARRCDGRDIIISSEIEHPCVREPLRTMLGAGVTHLSTSNSGVCDISMLSEMLKTQRVALVTMMAANNECGTLQPWRESSAICREHGVPFHTDAAQWIGKLAAHDLGNCDYVTGSGHKFGGPKGVGFLIMREEHEALHFLQGGPQEEGRRAGTENYPAIEAMVTALEWLNPQLEEIAAIQGKHRRQFLEALRHQFGEVRIIGDGAECLWNTVMFVAPHGDNRKWLARLSQAGFAVSTGSACSALKDGSSVVLAALGASAEEMQRVIRVSGGWQTSAEDWKGLSEALKSVRF